jgi:hypothetical protein
MKPLRGRKATGGQLPQGGAALALGFEMKPLRGKDPHRQKLVQVAYTVQRCRFAQAGVHLVELFCDGQWVADTALELI